MNQELVLTVLSWLAYGAVVLAMAFAPEPKRHGLSEDMTMRVIGALIMWPFFGYLLKFGGYALMHVGDFILRAPSF